MLRKTEENFILKRLTTAGVPEMTAQAERLSQYGCQPVIKDLGSGLNCKKPGLKRLLKLLLTGRVGALVVTHDDRLLRFGTELFHRSPHGHPYRHLR